MITTLTTVVTLTHGIVPFISPGNPWENTSPLGEALRNEIRALHSLHQLALAVEKANSVDNSQTRGGSKRTNSLDSVTSRFLNQFKKRSAKTQLRKQRTYNRYDAVVYLRPDMQLLHPLPIQLLSLYQQTLLVCAILLIPCRLLISV